MGKLYIPKEGDYDAFRKNYLEANNDGERVFLQEFLDNPGNTDKTTVEYRVRKLNSKYSTRLSTREIGAVVKLIVAPEFDEKLYNDRGNGYATISYLRILASERTKNGTIDAYSFATKYCHHCNPNHYPIYDSVNARVMTVYYGYQDTRDYEKFVECYRAFCMKLIPNIEGLKCQNDDAGFYVDKYIQAIGGTELRKFLP